MTTNLTRRREFLKQAGLVGSLGSAAIMAGMPESAMAFGSGAARIAGATRIVEEAVTPAQAEATPKDQIKFAVCGMSHDHIYGMIGAVQRGGGELVSYYGAEPDKLAIFAKRYPNAKRVMSEDEIIHDSSLQLVLSSTIPNQRAPLGVRVMLSGKDYLSDKPGMTTLAQVEDVRRTITKTGKIYGILYSERLEVKAAVKAGELVHAGAIGKVIQTINIAPHQIFQPGSRSTRSSRISATWSCAATWASATSASTGSPPTHSAPGATAVSSSSAPKATSSAANT
jgi:hypothetical protein